MTVYLQSGDEDLLQEVFVSLSQQVLLTLVMVVQEAVKTSHVIA